MSRWFWSLCCLSVLAGPAWAQEKVYVKNKDKYKLIKQDYKLGAIKDESPAGVTLGKELIPADDILDVEYNVDPVSLRLEYRNAVATDIEAHNPKAQAQRKANIEKARKLYQEIAGKIGAEQKAARRNIEFRLAYLATLQARDNPAQTASAITRLKAFAEGYRTGWQIVRALHMLAALQMEQKQYAEAEQSLQEIATLAKVPEAIKQEAALSAARVSLRAGQQAHEAKDMAKAKQEYAKALKKLDALIAGLKGGKDAVTLARAKVARSECLMTDAGGRDRGRTDLRDIIRDGKDKGVKSAAHNALGVSYFEAGEFKEARWEFLWVDLVYNQDKNEHAKALYYLWQTLKELGEGDRAQECLDVLLHDRQLAGLEYQVLAQRKSKS